MAGAASFARRLEDAHRVAQEGAPDAAKLRTHVASITNLIKSAASGGGVAKLDVASELEDGNFKALLIQLLQQTQAAKDATKVVVDALIACQSLGHGMWMESADLVEPLILAMQALIDEPNASRADWEVFMTAVAFLKQLLYKEEHPRQVAGRAAVRSGLGQVLVRASQLKPDLLIDETVCTLRYHEFFSSLQTSTEALKRKLKARAAAIEVAAGSTTAPPASPAGGWVRFLKPFADAGEATGDSDDAAGVRAAAAVLDASLTSLRSIPGDLCLRGALEEATKAANLLDRLNEISRGPHESTSHLNFSPFGPCNPAGRVIGGRRDQYLVQEMVSTALRNVTGVMLQRRRGSSSAGGGAGTGAGAGAGGGSASGGRAAKNPREPTPGSYFGISTSAAADGAPSPEHLWKAAKSALWSLAAIGTLSGLKTTDMIGQRSGTEAWEYQPWPKSQCESLPWLVVDQCHLLLDDNSEASDELLELGLHVINTIGASILMSGQPMEYAALAERVLKERPGHYAICHAALHVMHNQAAAATSHMRGEMLSGSSGGSFQVHAAIGKIAQSLIDYSAANPTDTETHSRVCYTLLMISSMGPEEDNFTGFESAPPTSAVDGVSFTRLQPAWAYVEPAALGAFLSRCCSLLHWNHQAVRFVFDSITKVFTAYKSRSVTARGKARAASGPLENLTKAFGKGGDAVVGICRGGLITPECQVYGLEGLHTLTLLQSVTDGSTAAAAKEVYSSGKDLLFPFAKRLIRDFKEHRDDDTMWGPMAQDCIEITFYFAALIPGALRRQSRHLRSSETEERGRKREDEAASELNSVSCVRVGSREWPDALEAAVELKALTGGRCCLHVPGASGAVRRVGSLPGKDFLYDQVLKDWLVVPTSSASPKSENGAEEKPGPSRAASARGKKKPAAATNAVPAAEVLRPAESSAVQPGPQPSAAETKLDSSTKAAAPGGVGKAADKENVNERCACARCGRTAAEAQVAKLKLCGGCRSVRYCGAECQGSHYPEHKSDCKRIAAEQKKQQNQ